MKRCHCLPFVLCERTPKKSHISYYPIKSALFLTVRVFGSRKEKELANILWLMTLHDGVRVLFFTSTHLCTERQCILFVCCASPPLYCKRSELLRGKALFLLLLLFLKPRVPEASIRVKHKSSFHKSMSDSPL